MKAVSLSDVHITDLCNIGTVTSVEAVNDDVEVFVTVLIDGQEQQVMKRINCQSEKQAKNVASLWKSVWY